MMNCKQATRLLSDSQERQLSLKEKTVLAMHTAMCSGCRNFAKHLGVIRNISQHYVKDDESDDSVAKKE